MNDIQVKDYGIKIVDDGTLHKKYRRYLYKGIELGVTHKQMLTMHTEKLSELIFEAGKERMRMDVRKLFALEMDQDNDVNYEQ
jgi:hypothetical protein